MEVNVKKYGRIAALAIPLGFAMNAVSPSAVEAGSCLKCLSAAGYHFCVSTNSGTTGCAMGSNASYCSSNGNVCFPPWMY